jgi:hypothetical protein
MTISQIREDLKTVETMESRLNKEMQMETAGVKGSLLEIDKVMNEWHNMMQNHELLIGEFSKGMVEYRAKESEIIVEKLSHV